MLPLNDTLPFNVVGESSVVSFSAFWVTAAALGATVLAAWGGYGKNSDTGLSLKRVGPLPAVKVAYLFCAASDYAECTDEIAYYWGLCFSGRPA
jgi:hypothetical protein